jgi:hypothetical protein
MNDEKRLRELLWAIYDRRSDAIRVSPAWLATEAMQELDPGRSAPPLVYMAANLQLRQMARAICRQRFEDDGDGAEQHDLWPDLQRRYPAVHSTDAEPEYVLLEHLTEADVVFNVNRLRAEAAAKMRHADALEAWWQDRSGRAA